MTITIAGLAGEGKPLVLESIRHFLVFEGYKTKKVLIVATKNGDIATLELLPK